MISSSRVIQDAHSGIIHSIIVLCNLDNDWSGYHKQTVLDYVDRFYSEDIRMGKNKKLGRFCYFTKELGTLPVLCILAYVYDKNQFVPEKYVEFLIKLRDNHEKVSNKKLGEIVFGVVSPDDVSPMQLDYIDQGINEVSPGSRTYIFKRPNRM